MLSFHETHAQSIAATYLDELRSVLARVPHEALARSIDVLLEARSGGRRVYVIGNGGSAATASHLVCDLVKTAHVPPYRPLRAFALTDNAAVLTAWANDSAYEHTFAEQIEAHVEPDDVLIAISASGNSPNILHGLAAASRNGARTIALLGFDGGAARALADVALHVPCDGYGLSEDAHSAICHAITAGIRHALELGTGAQHGCVPSR